MRTVRVPYFRIMLCHSIRSVNAVNVEQMLHLYSKKCGDDCIHTHTVQQLCWMTLSKEEIQHLKESLVDEDDEEDA